MAGTEKLVSKILSDARSAAQANLAGARAEAEGIVLDAREEAGALAAAAAQKAEREAAAHERRVISTAELEGRKELLAVKRRLIDDLFDEARDLLCRKSGAEYEALLLDMISASAFGDAEIILSERDRDRLPEGFQNSVNTVLGAVGKPYRLTLSDETRPIGGGFILRSGQIEINNSFESIIRNKRDSLESLAVKMLFG
jgi:V/A-type H+-transporting ATPase subunit E